MTLKEFIILLKQMENRYGPNITVIYASDDEGNSFHEIHHSPTAGMLDRRSGTFQDMLDEGTKPTHLCVN